VVIACLEVRKLKEGQGNGEKSGNYLMLGKSMAFSELPLEIVDHSGA